MKPIILVILGTAMLMFMIHRQNIRYSKQMRKKRTIRLQELHMKANSETDIHNIVFWIGRMP